MRQHNRYQLSSKLLECALKQGDTLALAQWIVYLCSFFQGVFGGLSRHYYIPPSGDVCLPFRLVHRQRIWWSTDASLTFRAPVPRRSTAFNAAGLAWKRSKVPAIGHFGPDSEGTLSGQPAGLESAGAQTLVEKERVRSKPKIKENKDQ